MVVWIARLALNWTELVWIGSVMWLNVCWATVISIQFNSLFNMPSLVFMCSMHNNIFGLYSLCIRRTHTLFQMMCINEHIFCVLYIFFFISMDISLRLLVWLMGANVEPCRSLYFQNVFALAWHGLACLQLQLQRNYFDATTFPNHFTINCVPFFGPRQNILY